jgi:hypothetical protein
MKSLAVADRYGWTRFVAHQVYYSLIGREYEWELMPLGIDQKVGALVWSPLGWGRLTGKCAAAAAARGEPPAQNRRRRAADWTMNTSTRWWMRWIKWPRRRASPFRRWRSTGCCSAHRLLGHRRRAQRGAVAAEPGARDWNLSAEQVAELDKASAVQPIYPYWHQRNFAERNPPPV